MAPATFWNEKPSRRSRSLKKGTWSSSPAISTSSNAEKDGGGHAHRERDPEPEVRGPLARDGRGWWPSDPELRTTEKGKTIARVLVAADEISKAGQKIDPSENKWHVALFFGDRAK